MGESVTEGSIVEWRKKSRRFRRRGRSARRGDDRQSRRRSSRDRSGVDHANSRARGRDGRASARCWPRSTRSKTDGAARLRRRPQRNRRRRRSRQTGRADRDAPAELTATPQAARHRASGSTSISRCVRGSGPERPDPALRRLRAGATRAPPARPRRSPQPPFPADANADAAAKDRRPRSAGYMEQSLSIPTATSFRTRARSTCSMRGARSSTAALKAAGPQREDFVHAPDRVCARARGARACRSSRIRFGATNPGRRRGSSPAFISVLRSTRERKDGTRSSSYR